QRLGHLGRGPARDAVGGDHGRRGGRLERGDRHAGGQRLQRRGGRERLVNAQREVELAPLREPGAEERQPEELIGCAAAPVRRVVLQGDDQLGRVVGGGGGEGQGAPFGAVGLLGRDDGAGGGDLGDPLGRSRVRVGRREVGRGRQPVGEGAGAVGGDPIGQRRRRPRGQHEDGGHRGGRQNNRSSLHGKIP